jgi:hypothetical protein
VAATGDDEKFVMKVILARSSFAKNAWVAAFLEVAGGKGGARSEAGSGSATVDSLRALSKSISEAEEWSWSATSPV